MSATRAGTRTPGDNENQFTICGTKAIARFVEKPESSQATHLVQVGGLWNTMIMVFKVKTLLQMFATLQPETYRLFRRLPVAPSSTIERRRLVKAYRRLKPFNFSKKVLEQAARKYPNSFRVLPVFDITWSDWGSPQRIFETVTAMQPASYATIAASPRPLHPRSPAGRRWPVVNPPRAQRQLG